jgi:hypothetical protein
MSQQPSEENTLSHLPFTNVETETESSQYKTVQQVYVRAQIQMQVTWLQPLHYAFLELRYEFHNFAFSMLVRKFLIWNQLI